jgi:hypothetical protein
MPGRAAMPVAVIATGVAATSGACSEPLHIVGITQPGLLLLAQVTRADGGRRIGTFISNQILHTPTASIPAV